MSTWSMAREGRATSAVVTVAVVDVLLDEVAAGREQHVVDAEVAYLGDPAEMRVLPADPVGVAKLPLEDDHLEPSAGQHRRQR
jgi:hypothetical protein